MHHNYMYVASLLHLAHHVLSDLGSRATRHFTIWSPSTEAVLMSGTGCDTGCFTQVAPIIWCMACRDRTRQLLVVFSSTGKQSRVPSVGNAAYATSEHIVNHRVFVLLGHRGGLHIRCDPIVRHSEQDVYISCMVVCSQMSVRHDYMSSTIS